MEQRLHVSERGKGRGGEGRGGEGRGKGRGGEGEGGERVCVRTGAGQPRGMEQRLHVSERGKGRGEGRKGEGRGEGACQYRSRTATGGGAASTRE